MSALWSTCRMVVYSLLTIYFLIPTVVYFVPSLGKTMLFLNHLKLPLTDYNDLKSHGVAYEGRNFYIQNGDLRLGVWQVLPADLSAGNLNSADFERVLSIQGYPTIIYLHGNAFDRTNSHRCEIYNTFAANNYHVLALDYRGFGDSTGAPDEPGVVDDSLALYNWAKQRSHKNPVFIWGHSLGTAIGTKLTVDLCTEGNCPVGLMLEAPFNNLHEVAAHHPLGLPYNWLPFFDGLFVSPMRASGLHMNTDERMRYVQCPVLMLHAMDDHIVPFKLAKKLEDMARQAHVDVSFHEFTHPRNYKHKYICRAPELPAIIAKFIDKCAPNARKT